jgi:NADH-quinone oxidoreductase subunit M
LVLGSVLIVFGVFPGLLIKMVNSGVEPLQPLLTALQAAPTLVGEVIR